MKKIFTLILCMSLSLLSSCSLEKSNNEFTADNEIFTYDGQFTDLLKETIISDKEISPAKDNRMTLIWE